MSGSYSFEVRTCKAHRGLADKYVKRYNTGGNRAKIQPVAPYQCEWCTSDNYML